MDGVVPKGSWTIADAMWAKIAPLLPRERPKPEGGRPRMPDRLAMAAIFYVLRTGCQWKALPRAMGAGSTVHDRFQEWVRAGVFERMWKAGLMTYDETLGIDWSWLAMDGAMTKAPLGGGATGPNPTDRGKTGTKRSVVTDARGVAVGLAVAGANRNDFKMLQETLDSMPVTPPPAESDNGDERPNLCLDKATTTPGCVSRYRPSAGAPTSVPVARRSRPSATSRGTVPAVGWFPAV